MKYILLFFIIILIWATRAIIFDQMQKLVQWNPVILLLKKTFSSSKSFVGTIINYLYSIFCNGIPLNLEKWLFTIGTIASTYWFIRKLLTLHKSFGWIPFHIISQQQYSKDKLIAKYGKCTVLITGSTDGIGFAFAQLFAQYEFNLILIGKDQSRIQSKIDQLKNICQKISIKSIKCDLSDEKQIFLMITKLQKMAQTDDIGIVINSAGFSKFGKYVQLDAIDIIDELNINVYGLMAINQCLFEKLKRRTTKSAIINITSCTGVYLSPSIAPYSTSKHIVDVYSRSLQLSSSNVDVMTLRPFGVTTKMMRMVKGPLMITPKQCATAALADLVSGRLVTFGHFKHQLSHSAFANQTQRQTFQKYTASWSAFAQKK